MLIPLAIAMALLGLLIGSFLNVVIWRVPRGESIAHPASHCGTCSAPIRPKDNVPVVSWVLLRGRCRQCRASISIRYPLVEVCTSLVFAGMALRVGADSALPAFLWVGGAGIALAVIDLDTRRLPNALTLPSYPVVGLLLALSALVDDRGGALVRACIGGAALWAGFFLLCVGTQGKGMGFGDVKLVGFLGLAEAWLGWGALAVGTFSAFLLGSVVGVALVLRGAGRKTKVPFGPFLVAGALVGIAAGQPLAAAYLGLTG